MTQPDLPLSRRIIQAAYCERCDAFTEDTFYCRQCGKPRRWTKTCACLGRCEHVQEYGATWQTAKESEEL